MPEIDSLSDLIPVFGRMHPLLLHLPIGMLVGLALLEIGNAIGRKPAASTFLVFFGAVTAAAAAASGLVLHEEPGYVESRVLELHEQLGRVKPRALFRHDKAFRVNLSGILTPPQCAPTCLRGRASVSGYTQRGRAGIPV